ncbi:MAG: hypothetical protein C0485_06695 [Pirellula sp.]|nr:hypothetical protein [Pirellula sp.]
MLISFELNRKPRSRCALSLNSNDNPLKTGRFRQPPIGASAQFAQSRPQKVCEPARSAKHCRARRD